MSEGTMLLWEVGCEELPAWACEQVLDQLPALVTTEVAGARLDAGGAVEVLVGPRRFTVRVPVLNAQRVETEEARGPAVAAAFKDGVATKACEGFARSKGLTPEQLEVREHNGTEFVFAIREASVEAIDSVWPDIAHRLLAGLSFAKPMKWGSSEHRFVRPIRWVATMLGDRAIEYPIWGLDSGAKTRTHRFLGASRHVEIASADSYSDELRSAHVIVDQNERRTTIERDLDAAATALGGSWEDPGKVLNEVVHLVEQPSVITGRFDERYLELPERVLVTAMQSHQRYFPVRSGDALSPAFLVVMNASPDAVDSIRPGYERVLVGRLDDAVFSFSRDRERGLDDMANSLGSVVFHAKAGSLADRTARITAIAAELARQVDADAAQVADACRLAKADQVSYVVQEFAELEGFAGSLYAAAAGYAEPVVDAIDQQFRPRGANAPMPAPGVPAIVALADKFDLLVTAWAIGEHPTGSRDPHGLRRAAIGIMRILLEHELQVDVDTVIRIAADEVERQGFAQPTPDMLEAIRAFVDDRVEKHLVDNGVRVDAVRAARAARLPQLQHLDGLARALTAEISSDNAAFTAVLAAATRCKRLLDKTEHSSDAQVDPSKFEADCEGALSRRLTDVAPAVRDAVGARDFTGAVAQAATLAGDVDAFFDTDGGVMVMADDADLRANRLALLTQVLAALSPLGDVHELQI